MKSLEELARIRERAIQKAQGQSEGGVAEQVNWTLTIGMATCGITAGARPVFTTILECMTESEAEDVRILQTGCFGQCSEEPMLKLEDKAGNIYYYGRLDPESAKEVFQKHVLGGTPLEKYRVEMEL